MEVFLILIILLAVMISLKYLMKEAAPEKSKGCELHRWEYIDNRLVCGICKLDPLQEQKFADHFNKQDED